MGMENYSDGIEWRWGYGDGMGMGWNGNRTGMGLNGMGMDAWEGIWQDGIGYMMG